jgi:hypothetical protein
MKKLLLSLLLTSTGSVLISAATVKQWDFNSLVFDGNPAIGIVRPNNGIGYPAESVAGVVNSFGQVSTASGSSDPNTLDNTHWRLGSIANTGGFPTATNANKTAGAQFRVNSSGYTNLHLMWDQENSATASRYWRIQYTTNAGSIWLDTTNLIVANPIGTPNPDTDTPTWLLGLTADFSALANVNDNTNFGFRFVSEFELTATGSGTNAYIANRTNSTYGVNGTFWLDMVTITGDDADPGNQWPAISAIPDQVVLTNQSTGPLAFTVSDAETDASNLVLTVVSTAPSLIGSFSFGGSDNNRTITVTPAAGQIGTAVVSVRAKDGGGKVTESSFRFTVVGTPTISRIFPQTTSWDVPLSNSFTVINLPGDPTTWSVTASSSNTNLVTNPNIVISGSDTNRTMLITPQTNALGDTIITIVATNAGYTATTNFLLRLAPAYIVEWNMLVVTSNTALATLPPTSVAVGLAVSDLSRGPGIGASGLTSGYSANRWENPASAFSPGNPSLSNAVFRGDFYQFTVTVQSNLNLSLATLDASLRRSALNAALNFQWQYSLDGFATPGVVILPRGPVWSVLGLTNGTTFTYQGRTSGSAPANLEQYDWLIKDVPGRTDLTTTPGDAIGTIDLTTISQLQAINGPKTVTIRLYGWGNASTVDSNTTGLGRVNGPRLRGTVTPSLVIVSVGSAVQLSWPTNASGFTLQSTTNLVPTNWQPVANPVGIIGDQYVVTNSASGTQFFRLIR